MIKFYTIFLAAMLVVGCERAPLSESVEWVTMGTNARIMCRDGRDLAVAGEVMGLFKDIESILSAHDNNSELSRLAPCSDAEILEKCSPLAKPCYEAAFKYRDMSEGRFNPRWRGEGTMDLGAIAKGYAVDLACEMIGEKDVLVDLGGNMKACGGKWCVAIYGTNRIVELQKGEACATSGEYFRGRHIKDGRDGSDVLQKGYSVTVVHSSSAMAADALTTILWITKEKDAARYDSGVRETIWQE